jgi:hypothetical protein
LTFGTVDFDPDCTLEGKSLLFVAYKGSSTWQIAESPIEGGSPKELVRGRLWSPSVSPDGKFLTYLKLDGQGANPTLKFVVQNLADSSSREILAPKGTLSIQMGVQHARRRGVRLGRPAIKTLSASELEMLRRDRTKGRLSLRALASKYAVSVFSAQKAVAGLDLTV